MVLSLQPALDASAFRIKFDLSFDLGSLETSPRFNQLVALEGSALVQFSDEILDLFGAPKLAQLRQVKLTSLPPAPNILDAAIWNYIRGVKYRDSAILHLKLSLLKRATGAQNEYEQGRSDLISYIEGLAQGSHRLNAYLSSLRHFEQCIGQCWQAAELFGRWENRILGLPPSKLRLFTKDDGSDYEKLNALNNVLKHFSAEQAATISAPIWITGEGLECASAVLRFDELSSYISSIWEVLRELFVDLPNEARRRDQQ